MLPISQFYRYVGCDWNEGRSAHFVIVLSNRQKLQLISYREISASHDGECRDDNVLGYSTETDVSEVFTGALRTSKTSVEAVSFIININLDSRGNKYL
jgi:hypothetical protein